MRITCKRCREKGEQCDKCKTYQQIYREAHRQEFRAYSKTYYEKHREIIRARDRALYHENPKEYQKRNRTRRIKNEYGLGEKEFNTLLVQQKNMCPLCEIEFTDRMKPCVDHCHKTGRTRGLLCRGCNLILGHIEKNKNYLALVNQYLNKSVK